MMDHPTRRITQGVGIVKGWEGKQDHKRIPDTFTYNKNYTILDLVVPARQHSKVLYRWGVGKKGNTEK